MLQIGSIWMDPTKKTRMDVAHVILKPNTSHVPTAHAPGVQQETVDDSCRGILVLHAV